MTYLEEYRDLTEYEKNQLLELGYIADRVKLKHLRSENSLLTDNYRRSLHKSDESKNNIFTDLKDRVNILCSDCGHNVGVIIDNHSDIAECDRCGHVNDIKTN
jgi:ribosomal protein S27AE